MIEEAQEKEEEVPTFPTDTTQSYISVYELPEMKMAKDLDGHATSIFVDGIREFKWCPHKNVIIHTSFPAGDVFPKITFMEMPSRRVLHSYSAKDSTELKLYLHPQGKYVAAMNAFQNKK